MSGRADLSRADLSRADFFRAEAIEHHTAAPNGEEAAAAVPAVTTGLRRGFWVVLAVPVVALAAGFVIRVDVRVDVRAGGDRPTETRSERLVDVLLRPFTGDLSGGPE